MRPHRVTWYGFGGENSAIGFTDALHGWVAWYDWSSAVLYETSDGGVTWTLVTPYAPVSTYLTDGLHGWAGKEREEGSSGFVRSTADGGRTWTTHAVPTRAEPSRLSAPRFFDAAKGVVVGYHSTFGDQPFMARTSDGGATWKESLPRVLGDLSLDSLDHVDRLSVEGTQNAWARAVTDFDDDYWVRSTDAGKHWVIESFGCSPALSSDIAYVDFVDPMHGWAVSGDGTKLLRTQVGGTPTKVSLVRSTSWKTLRVGRQYYASGSLTPAKSADSERIRIRAYKRGADSKYRYVKSFFAKYTSGTDYRAAIKFQSRSSKGRWKLVAYHPADRWSTAVYGSPDYVWVK